MATPAQSRPKNETLEFGQFQLDPLERLLLRNGVQIAITPKVFETLLALVENSGHMVSKEDLISRVWPDALVEEANLAVNISSLRKTLGETETCRYIETVPRYGYRFVAAVKRVVRENSGIVIEEHTRSRLVVEHEIETGSIEAVIQKLKTLLPVETLRRPPIVAALLSLSVLAIVSYGLYSTVTNRRSERVAAGVPKSIAILPFTRFSAPSNDDYLGLAIADALIIKLATIKRITVRPTSAVRRFVSDNRDPIAIGRELGVEAVIDGNIQQDNNSTRLTVQLLNVRDGSPLWTEKFDERASNILALEDLLSQEVVAALAVDLSLDEKKKFLKHATDNNDAYRSYLLGKYFFDRSGVAGAVEKAVNYYQQAIHFDPQFARAYAGLADAYSLDLAYPATPQLRADAHKRVEDAALKALSIDDSLAEAHTSLAKLKYYDWDWQGAEIEFRRAIELDPDDSSARFQYGAFLLTMARMDESLSELNKALELDPLSVNITITIGACLTSMGQYQRAIEQLHKTIDLSPTSLYPHIRLAQAYEMNGQFKESLAEYERAMELQRSPGTDSVGVGEIRLAQTYAFAGMRAAALKILDRWKQGPNAGRPSYDVAVIYAGLGDLKQAFEMLEQVYAVRDMNLLFVRTDPRLSSLRTDHRYVDLMRRMGLETKSVN